MQKRGILLLMVLLMAGSALAQDSEKSAVITGTVLNENDTPIPDASIALFASNQDSLINGTSTDSAGVFRLKARPGEYRLRVTYVSFSSFSNKIDLPANRELNVGEIHLNQETRQLEEVVVRGEETTITNRFDKRVMNVGQDVISMGGSALTVLDQMPSITTDYEGNVSLRGSQSIKILINGKPSSLVSNGSDGLQSVPAHMIKRVEVITNPSARYEAEGTAGVINIVLRKNREKGFNGSVSAETGLPSEHGVSTNLNFRRSNVNFFLNGGVEYEQDPGSGWERYRYNSPDTSYRYNQEHDSEQTEYEGDLRAGLEWFMPADQTLSFTTSVSLETSEDVTDVSYTDFYFNDPGQEDGTVMRRMQRTETENEDEEDLEFELNYDNQLPGHENHKLTAMAQIDMSTELESSVFDEEVTEGVNMPTEEQRAENEESYTRGILRVDYVYPHSEKLKLEAGLRSNYRDLGNDHLVEEYRDGSWVDITDLEAGVGGNFSFTENINAVYGIVGYQPGDWSLQLGLRAEQTNVETGLDQSSETTTRSYVDFFPTLHASYEFNQKQSVQASYSRRLSRPSHWHLIPYSSYADTRNRRLGNPALNPEFTDSYEVGFQQFWETGNALASVYYRNEKGVVEDITYQRDGLTYSQPINMATSHNWGLELTAEQELIEDLELRGSMNLYRSNTSGYHAESDNQLEASTSRLTSRMRLQYQFLGGWNYQASMRYRGPRQTTQGREFSSNSLDMGLSRTFWNDRARLSMRIRDVLNSRRHRSITDEEYLHVENVFRWRHRTFSLDFTYYFRRDFESEDRDGRRR